MSGPSSKVGQRQQRAGRGPVIQPLQDPYERGVGKNVGDADHQDAHTPVSATEGFGCGHHGIDVLDVALDRADIGPFAENLPRVGDRFGIVVIVDQSRGLRHTPLT
jgi:hypothetical protein